MFWWRLDNVLEMRVRGLLEQARRQGVQEGSPLYGLLQRGPRLLSAGTSCPALTALWPLLLLSI